MDVNVTLGKQMKSENFTINLQVIHEAVTLIDFNNLFRFKQWEIYQFECLCNSKDLSPTLFSRKHVLFS